jgi:hypothetical protein
MVFSAMAGAACQGNAKHFQPGLIIAEKATRRGENLKGAPLK